MNECNATLHGCLFAEEINNDFISNPTAAFDYLIFIYNSIILLNMSYSSFIKTLGNAKLVDSNQMIISYLIEASSKYSKKVNRILKKHFSLTIL